MKKLKLNLVLIALVLGVTGAVAFKPAHSKAKGTGDYWFDPTGMTYSGNQNPIADEETVDCDDSGTPVCQNGYRDDQLVTSGNPSNGVQPTQRSTPDERLHVTQQ